MSGWVRVGHVMRWHGETFPEPDDDELAQYPIDLAIHRQYVVNEIGKKSAKTGATS